MTGAGEGVTGVTGAGKGVMGVTGAGEGMMGVTGECVTGVTGAGDGIIPGWSILGAAATTSDGLQCPLTSTSSQIDGFKIELYSSTCIYIYIYNIP